MALAHGVIGNTTDFGSVILGSSPSGPTKKSPSSADGDFYFTGLLLKIKRTLAVVMRVNLQSGVDQEPASNV